MQHLIKKLHKNNEAAFEELYQLTHQKIYNFIYRYVKDSSSTKELTQQFFVKLWMKRKDLKSNKPLEGQIFTIARNMVIDELRKRARENRLVQNWADLQGQVSNCTEDAIYYQDLQEQLTAAIETLPQKRKQIFQLNRIQGLTYKEIAEELSISPKTVEKQMSKALKVMQAKLGSLLHLLLIIFVGIG